MAVSQNFGYRFGGPHNKDYSILGSVLGAPILGNYHMVVSITCGPFLGCPYNEIPINLGVCIQAPDCWNLVHTYIHICVCMYTYTCSGIHTCAFIH